MIRTVEYIVKDSGAWLDESESNKADCYVKFKEFDEVLPFTARRDDIYNYPEIILDMLANGEAGTVKSYAEYKAEKDAEQLEFMSSQFDYLTGEILAINPSANLPVDADLNNDGEITLAEMSEYLNILKQQKLLNKFS